MTSGTGFYRHELPAASWQRHRDDQIVAMSRGERVVHIGCADSPLTDQKLHDGELLHGKLLSACQYIIGVDVDADGIAKLSDQLGGEYLCADATDREAVGVVANTRPSLIVAADVIEHIANPGAFLDAMAMLAARGETPARLILSTPNALAARAPVLAAAGLELTHPDHRLIYSPTTLARALADVGFTATAWWTYSVSLGHTRVRRTFDAMAHFAGRIRPLTADGMIVIADLAGSSA